MSGARAPFRQRLHEALASETLPVALDRALGMFRQRRAAAFREADWQTLRDNATRVRRDSVDRLPELVEQFTAEAERAGAVVHLAGDAAEARRIVGEIAQRHGVTLAVKGKSMATEEIELNAYLEGLGVETVETDLGEWIIQLAHESPSHILAPAIHKRREDVAALFTRVTGRPVPPDDIPAIVQVARQELRQKFIDAGMGISGCNVAIAESGTLVLVSNEGNHQLSTTLPPVHVAVLGIEKIVGTLEDATAVLKVLGLAATGQKQSSYVNFITGPSRTGDIEVSLTVGVHGPKEVHIVLLDNGRTPMRADPAFREALRCIRCGACSNVCPPFSVVGGHAFGYIYTGPIGLVLTPWHHGVEAASGPQSLCFSCNACETVCPVSIPLPRLIIGVREQAAKRGKPPLAKRLGTGMLEDPAGRGAVTALGRVAQLPLGKGDGFIAGPGLPGSAWRHLPALPAKPFRARLSRREREGAVLAPRQAPIAGSAAAGLRVAYFPGCITDRFYPAMGEAVVRLLQACGCEVVFPPAQGCCGLPAANAGGRERAEQMARDTVAALGGARVDWIVSSSTSCAVAITQDYAHLLAGDAAVKDAEALAGRVIDLTHFLHDVAKLPAGSLAVASRRATYHDSCQSFNCLGLSAEGRRLLCEVAGAELVEMEEPSVCCGFGGGASFEHPEVARRIAARKLDHIGATQAAFVVTDNPGCILHLRGALHARRSRVRAQHLAEFLAEGLPPAGGRADAR
ncbi:MAG TPA: LUD domain-containing protein [Dehalococcoidia bacterium]|nr:LUD domain-containing protein [Dehalococcoidia bacterium]